MCLMHSTNSDRKTCKPPGRLKWHRVCTLNFDPCTHSVCTCGNELERPWGLRRCAAHQQGHQQITNMLQYDRSKPWYVDSNMLWYLKKLLDFFNTKASCHLQYRYVGYTAQFSILHSLERKGSSWDSRLERGVSARAQQRPKTAPKSEIQCRE